MGLINDLNPTNYQEEKEHFLADPTFDPQFEYVRNFSEEELLKNGLTNKKYTALAQKILDFHSEKFTPEEFDKKRGRLLSQEEVGVAIEKFLKAHHLDSQFKITWSTDFVSRAAVTSSDVIKLRLPCAIREQDLIGLIYHEIGTHALRRVNYRQQPWHRKKKRFGFSPYLKTEEGLATLHALINQRNPVAYKALVNYLAVKKAQESSFLEVWHFIRQYIGDDERAFAMTFKKKRGLTDTQRPGGFTKDFVYFEGLVDIVRFLIKEDFPIKELYFGKISWQDIGKAVEFNPDFEPLLPNFYTDDPEEYKRAVTRVAQTNFLI